LWFWLRLSIAKIAKVIERFTNVPFVAISKAANRQQAASQSQQKIAERKTNFILMAAGWRIVAKKSTNMAKFN